MSAYSSPAHRASCAAMDAALAAIPAPERMEPWTDEPYEEWLDVREYAAAYYGVHPDTLTDLNVQTFSRLTGTVVRR
jgi:hypothetical protein